MITDLNSLITYLRDTLSPDDVNEAVIILQLLERGGRATKDDLIHRLAKFNDAVYFYYEDVLRPTTDFDLETEDAFTYDEKTENYFLNVSMNDTFLVDQAIRLCRNHINTWRERKEATGETEPGNTPKLVRDRIPELIETEGRTPIVEHVSGDQLREHLLEKLTEEHLELLRDTNLDEISDLIEVLLGLGHLLGYDEEAVMAAVHEKRATRGGFSQGTYLKKVVVPQPEET